MTAEHFSPKEFLRARRPERFSDSIIEEEPTLNRSMLEYHLDTLTSRSQEVKFEHFARRLAEREICPNLLPQTGPTGGGDSKVDSETYPVADSLSIGWYEGIGRKAASERWAFAFSAKKKWQGKARSDVKKIIVTGRGYRKAFFVSNQYIRDKARADMEDELSAEYNIDVRILDRTWILDKVFENGHEALAVEKLELTISTRKKMWKGPLDTQRERDLDKLEELIQNELQEQQYSPQLVENCIDVALLARQLERPRTEIEGRFERAERVAIKYGTPHQQLECAYQRAWTVFWWYEDYEQFIKLYGIAEERAKGSRNAYHLERLSTLWHLLHGAIRGIGINEVNSAYRERTDTLTKELERLGKEQDRPSTALQAQTMLLEMQLGLKLASQEPIDTVLHNLQEIIYQCEGLAGYPLESLVKILMELGQVIDGVPAYEELFETIVEVTSTRKGEVSSARVLLKRGEQQLHADRPYDAIRSLGRALRCLYKHESRYESVRALYLCGCAYERVGLLWAARGTLLTAASLATDEFWRYEDVTPLQAACYRRLKWLELQLGRLPQILEWHKADRSIRSILVGQGYDKSHLFKEDLDFDCILGTLLLKTDIWEIKRLSTLPDVLEELGLPGASLALIYALGHEDEVRDENYYEVWGDEDLYNVFLKWRDQLALKGLPERPLLYAERKVTLRSSILGCQVTVESENNSPCVELAESVLAALESFLSTGTVKRMVAHEPVLTIAVRKSDFAKQPFEFKLQDRIGRPHLKIACPVFSPHRMSLEAQSKIKERLFDLLAIIIGRVVASENLDWLEKLCREELALDRSVGFSSSFVTVGNVLGNDPKIQISKWSDPQAQEYPLKRSRSWDTDDAHTEKQSHPGVESLAVTPSEEEPYPDMFDLEHVKHTQIQTVSLIRETLWDKAKWWGTYFGTFPDESAHPILALMFKNLEPAKQIFMQWRSELGMHDEDERIRVAIVRGINKSKPYSYRIIIGSNPNAGYSQPDIRYTALASRTHTMVPDSDLNLKRFHHSYKTCGGYLFAPATARDESSDPEIIWDHCLSKREFYVRDAWEIGRNDIDCVAIREDDAPIIPSGQNNPPVLELLHWMREHLSSSTESSSESGKRGEF